VKDVRRAWLTANSGYLRLELTTDCLHRAWIEAPNYSMLRQERRFDDQPSSERGPI